MTRTADPSISLRDVQMTFAQWDTTTDALRGVTLDLPPKGLVLVVGENASGKSTLLRVIAGTLRPTAGRVAVFGKDPSHVSADWRARHIGFVGQHPERDLVPGFSVSEHLRLIGHDWKSFEARLSELEPTGHFSLLLSARSHPVEGLSGGQRQSLGLALQLVRPVPLLLLDEPFASLDSARLEAFTAMVCRLARTMCVVKVTHAPDFLRADADLEVHLAAGCATVRDLRKGAANEKGYEAGKAESHTFIS